MCSYSANSFVDMPSEIKVPGEFLGSPRIKQHLLGNGMDLCLKPRRFELQDEVCCYKCSQCFVLETNTLWFWKHLVVQAYGCNVQNTGGALSVLVLFLLRSFILPKAQIPVWWSWGYLINQGLRQCYQLRCK
ncbi:hypothetical protein LWI29_028611 [Acer saccharum]|uniref:Uncharacterized protein n=1 Tax=Acer saccharum TaxID=4024 RepID=A0AA39RP22_ACESA|nr:hypothetical protein LWI29_028611 [Acer saccharum]